MARVIKEAKERKNEILDVAERLFETRGFDHTSTNDILEETGIARGTLYYHFKSKEELLDAMVERMTERLIVRAKEIAARKDVPVLQRFTRMMLALHAGGSIDQEILEQVHKPQNALMHQKIQQQLLTEITPLLVALIEEGTAQGICHTEYPLEVAEMTFLYANVVFDDLAEYGTEEKQRKIAAFIHNLERLLGMGQGSMREAVMPVFRDSGDKI